MKVMNILHDSIVDGEGLRTVVFFAGCIHFCKGCHNPLSWSRENGIDMTIDEIYEEIMSNPLTDVTFSGGEPFMQADELQVLARRLKESNKNIWIYSGYTFDQLYDHPNPACRNVLNYCDVLVDGKFELDKQDPNLLFRGSANQQIIYLHTS